jgi:hypothetical protein
MDALTIYFFQMTFLEAIFTCLRLEKDEIFTVNSSSSEETYETTCARCVVSSIS